MKLVALNDRSTPSSALSDAQVVVLANDADPLTLALDGVQRVELDFPRFSDGRAFSQAQLLRRRRGFQGEIRATGDVLIDQLLQMQRCGFDSAVLRPDLEVDGIDDIIARQLGRYPAFYQGDIAQAPHFSRT